jgi:hypothetical protein
VLNHPSDCSKEKLRRRFVRRIGTGKVDGTAWNDGGNSVFVDHLRHSVAKQNDVLVERLDLALEFDAIDQVDGHWHMLAAQSVEEGILQKLPFVVHDILRVLIEIRVLP